MRFYLLLCGVFISFACTARMADTTDLPGRIDNRRFDPSTLLWYSAPASAWEAALPVGNGRLGAMVFGRAGEERIQLNKDTYWTGGPYSTVVKGGYRMLPEVRKLVFAGKYLEAQTVFGRYLMGYPVEQQKYQCLGNLHLFFPDQSNVSGYKRWLDLETGITGVQYVSGGVTFRREVFASFPDQVVVIRMTADKPGSISFTARLRGVRNQTHSNYATDYFRMDGVPDGLVLTGKSADYMGVAGKLRYEARLRAVPEGGAMKVEGDLLTISGANVVTLYVVAATNFVNYRDVSGDAHGRVEEYLGKLSGKTYPDLRDAHIRDYRSLFARVSLHLPVTDVSYEPTDQRKAKVSDPDLAALAYQFGRYVLIASSRPGSQPANLQGVWNDNPNPMWDSKYTTNINTQMNYWPVESGNLSECADPLFKMIAELTDQGAQVAAQHYGCRGWVFHQNTDLWRVAAPMDGPTWGTFTVGGAWLCTHLWEHFAYTADTAFLRRVYPILKGSVQFFLDFLVPTPDGRWLVTNPSSSPENFPDRPGNGRYFDEVIGAFLPGTNVCAGSSIDMQVLTDLFREYVQAAGILRMDAGMADSARGALSRLLPPRIGKDSTLQEWAEDWGQTEHPHRHLSPLYGLYPGNVFSFSKTPGLMEPCRRLLAQRGDSSAEWARAWKVALWARLREGNRADAILKGYFRDESNPQFFGNHGFPVQVDGTLGSAAGISEMLVQSGDGVVELLPALPDEWSSGSLDGVCTRGAFEWGLRWAAGRITQATVRSKQGLVCRLQAHEDVVIKCGGVEVRVRRLEGGVVEFPTEKGAGYEIVPTGFLPEDIARVDSVVGVFMEKYHVPGLSFTIAQHDSIKIERCYGYADKDKNQLMTPDNRFRIASISKPITATAIMQLVEGGKLRLGDKIFGPGALLGTTYGSYPYKKWVEDLTVEILLEHLGGGWGNNDDNDPMFLHPEMNHGQLISWTLDNQPLKNEPGTHYQYSNFGFCILGRVIEKVTGKRYEDYVRQNVLEPCGITDMQIGGNTLAERLPGEVYYYDKAEDPYGMNVRRMDSHGGWIATPTDLVNFVMRVDKFPQKADMLQPATLDTMFAAPAVNPGYAKGWAVNKFDNYWHSGSLPGQGSIMARVHIGFCWAVMVNTRSEGDFNGDLDRLMWQIERAITYWPDIELKK